MIRLNDGKYIEYTSSGLFRSKGKWIHPERICNTYVLFFILKGTVRIYEEDCRFELHENDIMLLEPDKQHGGFELTDEEVSYYWMHFSTDMDINLKTATAENPHSLKTLFSQLMHITNTPGYSPDTPHIICSLIAEEIKFISGQESVSGTRLATEIKEYIRLNINGEINVNMIADHFGYHENYIGKIFKRAYGMGMKNYITDLKLKKTQDYLLTTLYTIKEIAYMNGFKTENHFVKFFKYHLGVTPSEYRNTYINTHINNS